MSETPTLRELLGRAGISDREVERRTGVQRTVLRGYERGTTRRPAWHVCARLASLLGLDVLDVLAAAVESIRRANAERRTEP